MTRRATSPAGFTLIEMMITIGIIGVLASAAIPAFIRYMHKARNIEGLHNVRKIGKSLEAYYEAHSRGPDVMAGFGQHWDAWAGLTPRLNWAEYCERGVFPPSAVQEFNAGSDGKVWNALLFQPEGNIRFYYWYDVWGNTPNTLYGGYLEAYRNLRCAPDKGVAYLGRFKLTEQRLTLVGPRQTEF